MQPNLIDRVVSYLSPQAGVQRMAARRAMTMVYDAAARTHRTGWKRVTSSSANSEILLSLARLRDVSRDFARNNPVASNIHNAIPMNVVGAGILPTPVIAGSRKKKQLRALMAAHLETPAIDFDGRSNFYALQWLAVRTMVESGEVLLVRYRPPSRLKLPVPLQVRILDPHYLDPFKNGGLPGGGVLFQGIEFDADGRRVAYWLYDEHPGGGISWKLPVSRRVDAADVIHLYRTDLPGQMRGVPWGAPCFVTMGDSADYEDAERVRQKIAACFAVFWTGTEAGGLAASVTGDKTPAGQMIESVEPGMIQRLPQGSDVKFATPPQLSGYREFTTHNARKVCAGYGVTYEVGTGDLSGVSFISGRLGQLQMNRNVDVWRWQTVIPHLCEGIANWFLQSAAIPLGGAIDCTFTWTPPRKEMVSPKDEINPIRDAIRSGLTSRQSEIRKLGDDPETIEAENKADAEKADSDKLIYDSDGRHPLHGQAFAASANETGGGADLPQAGNSQAG